MDATLRRPRSVERWVLGRLERFGQLNPLDGMHYGLSLAEARRLLAYGGFSLYRDAAALGLDPASMLPGMKVQRRVA